MSLTVGIGTHYRQDPIANMTNPIAIRKSRDKIVLEGGVFDPCYEQNETEW